MTMAWMTFAASLQVLLRQLGRQGCPAHSDPAEHLQHAIGSSVTLGGRLSFSMPTDIMVIVSMWPWTVSLTSSGAGQGHSQVVTVSRTLFLLNACKNVGGLTTMQYMPDKSRH